MAALSRIVRDNNIPENCWGRACDEESEEQAIVEKSDFDSGE